MCPHKCPFASNIKISFGIQKKCLTKPFIYSIFQNKYRGERTMKFLSRQEELMLLTILLLRSEAYGVPIREKIAKLTDKSWSIGAVYDILDRLTRKGLVSVPAREPVKPRGGK